MPGKGRLERLGNPTQQQTPSVRLEQSREVSRAQPEEMGQFCPSYQQILKYYFFLLKQLAMKPFNNITEKVRERISHFLSKQVASIASCLPGTRQQEHTLHPELTGARTPLPGPTCLVAGGFLWVLAFLIAGAGWKDGPWRGVVRCGACCGSGQGTRGSVIGSSGEGPC